MSHVDSDSHSLADRFARCVDCLRNDADKLPRATVAYYEATLNEIAVDRQTMNLSDVWSRFGLTIPRFTRLPSFVQNHPRAAVLMLKCVNVLWPVLFPAIVLWQTVCMLWRQSKRVRHDAQAVGTEPLAFVCNRRHEQLVESTLEEACTSICPPGTNAPDNADWLDIVQLVSRREILKAAWASIGIGLRSPRYLPQKSDRLQTYTALAFLVTWTALEKCVHPGQSVRTANHYDRWAILLDRLPVSADRWVIQHGMLYADRLIPCKLNHTNRLVVFDDESADAFRQCVLNENSATDIEVRPWKIPLTEIPNRDAACTYLLLIGNLLHAEDEDRVIQLVRSMPNLRLLVKPHPRTDLGRYESIAAEGGIQVWPHRELFPNVDAVISPESTLGKEYEAVDIPVIWYARLSHEECAAAVRNLNLHQTESEQHTKRAA